VVVSIMLESLILALAGGVLGAIAAYVLFNNMAVSTLGSNFTQVVFRFAVTPALVVNGLIIAVAIGMVGGFLPALRAARQPVTTALRAA
jgi:putative ABC transport system permease protein